MAVMIFYCPHCEQMFTGEGTAADKPSCPHCGQATQSTGYTKEEWIALMPDQRIAALKAVSKPMDSDNNNVVEDKPVHVGEKIKSVASALCAVEMLATGVGIVWWMTEIEDEEMLVLALLAAVVGIFLAWVSWLLLYAYGELVEKTAANERNTHRILQLMQQNYAQQNKTED